LLSTGHGGQLLVTETVRRLLEGTLPREVELRDLHEHQLRDLQEPERVWQVLAPGLPVDFPPLRSLDARRDNLPVQVTSMIGREDDMAAVGQLLGNGGVRLVTLTGPGGTGKTRVALAVAASLLADAPEILPDGVWFVDLAPLVDPTLVLPAIAGALGVREGAGQTLRESLLSFLAGKRLLLVLDNFEHLLSAAPLVSDLLQAGPGIAALVTSREPLRVRGEREVAVAPLSLPDEEASLPLDVLAQIPAVALFIERAQAAQADFALTPENAAAVAAICRRLDGLPLALELAAARIKVLPPAALLARLEQRLPLLTSGLRDAPARQRTLRDTIAWSYDLLSAEEQVLFRYLAVFVGGWTLEAAEAVANSHLDRDVLSGLASLVDKSLIQPLAPASGEPRFGMLETIREFATERLVASEEAAAIRHAHAATFRRLVEAAEPQLVGAEQESWIERLDADLGNIRAALAWAVEIGEWTTIQQIAGSLIEFWDVRGLFSEGLSWLEHALTEAAPSAERVKALLAAGVLAHGLGDLDRARTFCEQSLMLAREFGDERGIARALNMLGNYAESRGDLAQAEAHFEEAAAMLRRLGDMRGVAAVLNNLAVAVGNAGDSDRAVALLHEVLVASRATRDSRSTVAVLLNLGDLARDRGKPDEAKAVADEALLLARELGSTSAIASALGLLGLLATDEGDVVRAATFLGEELELLRQLDDREATVAELEALAKTALLAQQSARACRLLGASEALREAIETPIPLIARETYNRDVGATRMALGEAGFAAAWAAGRALTLEQAMAEALALVVLLAGDRA
jgi:predicted ATPase